MSFPIDLSSLRSLSFSPRESALSDAQHEALRHNIRLVRDSLIFFTALANARGLGGHTGGAYDINILFFMDLPALKKTPWSVRKHGPADERRHALFVFPAFGTLQDDDSLDRKSVV